MEMELRDYAEKILTYMTDEAYKPMTVKELEQALRIVEAADFRLFVKALVALEEHGEIVRTRSDRYGLPNKMNLVKGVVIGNAKGFAFVQQEDSSLDDIYIPAHELNNALHGDTVLVRITPRSGGQRQEGSIVRILERGVVQSVGTYTENAGVGFVVPDDKKLMRDIFVPKHARGGAVDGHKVVYRITRYPDAIRSAEGEIVQILGHRNDPGVDILSIIYKHGLPQEFPADVLTQANRTADTISDQDLLGRRDLREEMIVTIDGADAKDLDDAVTVKRLENGHFKLGVHIADVSYYVTEKSPIDVEAYERGTSVYLVDRVIPMIPHRLSNGICSLNPQVDRLTLSCEMEIDGDGKVVSHEIFQSVIRTTARMTYGDVNAILVKKDQLLMEQYASLVPMFQEMETLATILRKKRAQRGAIDFDFKEAKVLVDAEGNPENVVIRERSIAEKLIEEFMLAANETVAEHFHWLDVPFIYRIHEDPNEERLQRFFEFIIHFGYIVRGTANEIHPRALQEILDAVRGKPEEMVISTVMLRSMKQAKYAPKNEGHFGLSTEFYTHFTSPIRRYPDLIVHRLIRTYLIEGKMDEQVQAAWAEKLVEITKHSSSMERRAVDAERETDELKKAEWMLDKVGEEFIGIISSVTSWGLFVELENTIEGLVHVSNMTDDYYHFNDRQYAMIGERTGKVFRIGDEITVRCLSVDKEERTIDFEIVGMPVRQRHTERETKIIKVNKSKKLNKMVGRERSYRASKEKALDAFNVQSTNQHEKHRRKKSDSETPAARNTKPKKVRYYPNDTGQTSSSGEKFYESLPKNKRKGKSKRGNN